MSTAARHRSSRLERLGRTSARRYWRVIGAWVLAAVVFFALSSVVGGELDPVLDVPGTEAQRANDLLEDRFPQQAGSTAMIVFRIREGTLRDPGAAQGVRAVVDEAKRLPDAISVTDALGPGSISPDGTIAFSTVRYAVRAAEVGQDGRERLEDTARAARDGPLQVEFGGEVLAANQPNEAGSEGIGILAAAVILVIAFGSLVAAGLPLVITLFNVGLGLSVVFLIANFVDFPIFAPILAIMLGLGAGIDYALFIVTRYRQNLHDGMSLDDAVGHAISTAGLAVLFAGGTVVFAILGLWISGVPFVGLAGSAAAIVILVSIVAAVTLLPALLGLIGPRIDHLRIPRVRTLTLHTHDASGRPHGYARWANRVTRRPGVFLALGLVLLLVLAAPVLDLRLGQVDPGSSPTTHTDRRAYDLLAEGFGFGFNGPLQIVVEARRSDDRAAVQRVAGAVREEPGIVAVGPQSFNRERDTAVFTATPATSPSDEATTKLVERLRDDVLPEATAGSSARVYVSGPTATNIDMADKLSSRLPVFVAAVILVSFVLLITVFRSLAVPIKAAMMNLLSVGAAYGVIVAVFQWGWGRSLLGVDDEIPIDPGLPMIMFAILFGLSMDYEVFLLSRIREEYAETRDNLRSVADGLATTAPIITAAALIMIVVFLSFVLNPLPLVKLLGVGLATAVLVDATIVRLLLVPATMALLGDRNWWIPRWLDRAIPRLERE